MLNMLSKVWRGSEYSLSWCYANCQKYLPEFLIFALPIHSPFFLFSFFFPKFSLKNNCSCVLHRESDSCLWFEDIGLSGTCHDLTISRVWLRVKYYDSSIRSTYCSPSIERLSSHTSLPQLQPNKTPFCFRTGGEKKKNSIDLRILNDIGQSH